MWPRIQFLAKGFIELANSNISLKDFAERANAILLDVPTRYLPKKMFTPGSARTVYCTENNIYARLKQAKSGEIQSINIAIASPRALHNMGFNMITPLNQYKYMGAIVHEQFEIETILAQKLDEAFAKQYSHACADVLRGHGYFLYGINVQQEQLNNFVRQQDLQLIREGWSIAEGEMK